ncbi:MAG: hypothetical protein ACYTGB_04075 [Planctomycetota bacterium]|jgi:hypothetical protein
MPEDVEGKPPADEERQMTKEELEDLRYEVKKYQDEKENFLKIVGRIGGVPSFNTKTLNFVFAGMVAGCLAISLFTSATVQLGMIELAVALVSIKLIILIHRQSKVNHLQLWILSSLEWRMDEMMKQLRKKD